MLRPATTVVALSLSTVVALSTVVTCSAVGRKIAFIKQLIDDGYLKIVIALMGDRDNELV